MLHKIPMTQWPFIVICIVNICGKLKLPKQSQISKLISQYQQFYNYTEDFRHLTHNITISKFYAGLEILPKNLQAAKPQPKAAEQVTISRHPLRLKASQPTRTNC